MQSGIAQKNAADQLEPRACLKIAFCKILSQFASGFMLDLGGVVGYIDEIQHKNLVENGAENCGNEFSNTL